MPNPYRYRSVLNRLARLTDASHPAHVRVDAAVTLAKELSPANPRCDLIRQMLQAVDPYEFARHSLRDLYDRAVPLVHEQSAESAQPPEEAAPEEDDDPL